MLLKVTYFKYCTLFSIYTTTNIRYKLSEDPLSNMMFIIYFFLLNDNFYEQRSENNEKTQK